MQPDPLSTAAQALRSADSVLVISGAGMSAESGIPTFRGEGGLWEGFRAEDLASMPGFQASPSRVWRWYQWRRGLCLEASPHEGHRVIARMEAHYPRFLLATQNIDDLHPQAGSRQIVEIHGNIHQGMCTRCGASETLGEPRTEEEAPLPACTPCGGLLRPKVLWFGESYWPGLLEEAGNFALSAQVVLVVGTSGMVWTPIAIALAARRAGATLIDINPEAGAVPEVDCWLEGKAGEILPRLWESVERV